MGLDEAVRKISVSRRRFIAATIAATPSAALVAYAASREAGNALRNLAVVATGSLLRRPDSKAEDFGIGVSAFPHNSNSGSVLSSVNGLNVGYVKLLFEWRHIQPRRNMYMWGDADGLMRLFTGTGYRVVARLDIQPTWAAPDTGAGQHSRPADLNDYAGFVEAFVSRYVGRLYGVEIWNEPNLSAEWGKQTSPEEYAEMLRLAYISAKKADPKVKVISAGLAQLTEDGEKAIGTMHYLERMYEAGAPEFFDLQGVHAYGFGKEPDLFSGSIESFSAIQLINSLMRQKGVGKGIAVTEVGWTTDNVNEEYASQAVSPEQQAEYLSSAIALAQRNSKVMGIGPFLIWTLPDDRWTMTDQRAFFSITDLSFNPLPAYGAVAKAAQAVKKKL